MNIEQANRFKNLLSVPSKTYKEEMMIDHIVNFLTKIPGISFKTDHMGNIYVTKGVLNQGEFYPMLIAHTDTVHEIQSEIVVKDEFLTKPTTFGKTFGNETYASYKAYTPGGLPTGIGGDDKCGIFLCLELLMELPKVKIGLFVSEETGCHGSQQCDLEFLEDVGYAIQFDAPGNHLITEICSGVRLFEKDGEFIDTIVPIFSKYMNTDPMLQSHPYTDVSQIKRKGDFSCINLSCGYYNMHSVQEFVVLEDVEKVFYMTKEIVRQLGTKKYEFEYVNPMSSSFFNLFENQENSYDEDLEDYKIDMYYMGNDLIIENEMTGDGITLSPDDIDRLLDLVDKRYEDYLD